MSDEYTPRPSQVLPKRPRALKRYATQIYLVCEDYRVLGLGSTIVAAQAAEQTADNLALEAFSGLTEGSHAVICVGVGPALIHHLSALYALGQFLRIAAQ